MKRKLTSIEMLVVQFAVMLLGCGAIAADGGLSAELIGQIRSSFKMDPHARAMYNAITNNDIQTLALSREMVRQHNEIFSHKIDVKGVTNQKSSGRCWLFAGLNNLRQAVIKKHNLEKFEFSQNYLTFWDKLEKANTFLERIIELRQRDLLDREMELLLREPAPDGGYWESVVNLVQKYGIVPKEVMPETHSSENTRLMNRILDQKLRVDAAKLRELFQRGKSAPELRAEKERMLAEVYRILAVNLGEPPAEFEWRYEQKSAKDKDAQAQPATDRADEAQQAEQKPSDANKPLIKELRTTPKGFFEEFVGADLNEYVDIFNDATHDYGKHYQIRMSRNIYEGRDVDYANVEIGVLKEIAMRSLLEDTPVMFDCDVGYDQDKKLGIMAEGLYDYNSIYGIDLALTKAQRALLRNSTRNHGMVLVGVDVRDGKAVKWRVENSWGDETGSKGYWTMYDGWFDLYVYSIIVKKKYVPEEVLQIYQQPAVVLPPWDPMLGR